MVKPKRSMRSIGLLLALILPSGIATHLAGEFGALGMTRDLPVALGAQHLYLALLGLASIAMAFAIARREFAGSATGGAARLIAGLPWRGEGWRFAALCFAAQMTFFVLTQVLEGTPLGAGDVVLGLATAAATALCSSLAIVRFKDALARFAIRMCASWFVARRSGAVWYVRVIRPARTARRRRALLATQASRPPPRSIVSA